MMDRRTRVWSNLLSALAIWPKKRRRLSRSLGNTNFEINCTNLLLTCVLYLFAYSIARNTYTIMKHENRAKKCEKIADACTSQFYFTYFSWRRWWWRRRWWWLWSQRRWLLIQFKIAVLRYRVLHGDASRYMGPFTSTADVPGRRALRSAGTKRLVVPSARLSTVGSRAFLVAAAQIWNSLPEYIVSAPTLQSLRRHLKMFLLQQSFCL